MNRFLFLLLLIFPGIFSFGLLKSVVLPQKIPPNQEKIQFEKTLISTVEALLPTPVLEQYHKLIPNLEKAYLKIKPRFFMQYSPKIFSKIQTHEKIIALTFDACGGPGKLGNGFDQELISLLTKENIPATLFITAKWIYHNSENFQELLKNPRFDLANHGLLHKPASVKGLRIYHIKGTANIRELIQEVELNALYLQHFTGKKPHFFRSGTAYYDDVALKIIRELGYYPLNFTIAPGDSYNSRDKIVRDFLRRLKPGAIAIMHLNHPRRFTKEALEILIPLLKIKGYRFVLLKDYLEKLR